MQLSVENPSCKVQCGDGYQEGEGEYKCEADGGKAVTGLKCKSDETLKWYMKWAVKLGIMKKKDAKEMARAQVMKKKQKKRDKALKAKAESNGDHAVGDF